MTSSLIFLMIVGLWAVFLVPQWLRRREQLGASRTRDRFSTAMRVLGRRDPRPAIAGRGARPSVLRAAAPKDDDAPSEPAVGPTRRVARQGFRVAVLALVAAAVVTLAAPATVVLAMFGVVPVWTTALPPLALAGLLVLLRGRALRRRARRPGVPGRRPAERARPPATAPAAAVDPVPAPAAISAAASCVGSEGQAAAEPGTWTPVPVPPPTYTLKPPAYRRPVRTAEPPVVEPATPAAAWDLEAVLERRRAAGA